MYEFLIAHHVYLQQASQRNWTSSETKVERFVMYSLFDVIHVSFIAVRTVKLLHVDSETL